MKRTDPLVSCNLDGNGMGWLGVVGWGKMQGCAGGSTPRVPRSGFKGGQVKKMKGNVLGGGKSEQQTGWDVPQKSC